MKAGFTDITTLRKNHPRKNLAEALIGVSMSNSGKSPLLGIQLDHEFLVDHGIDRQSKLDFWFNKRTKKVCLHFHDKGKLRLSWKEGHHRSTFRLAYQDGMPFVRPSQGMAFEGFDPEERCMYFELPKATKWKVPAPKAA